MLAGLADSLGVEGRHHGKLVTQYPVVSPGIISEPDLSDDVMTSHTATQPSYLLHFVYQSCSRGLQLAQDLLPPAERDEVVLVAELPGGEGDGTLGQPQHRAGGLGVRVEVKLCAARHVADALLRFCETFM